MDMVLANISLGDKQKRNKKKEQHAADSDETLHRNHYL